MLTPQEHNTLQFIRRHIAQHGCAPMLSVIGTAIGVKSTGTVHRYVKSLEQKGFIERKFRAVQGIQLTDLPLVAPAVIPLFGRIAAGQPIEAIEEHQAINLIELLMGSDRFALQVSGDSMIDAGIHHGDYVIFHHRDQANNGDIVIALIDEREATLKRFKRRGTGEIELIPANTRMKPLIYAPERIRIQGVLVAQMRSYR